MTEPTEQLCNGCMYRDPEMRDGGWCYMFKDAPTTNFCGQFRLPNDWTQRKATPLALSALLTAMEMTK